MQPHEVDNSSPCSKDHILHTIYNTYNFHKSTFLSQSNKTNNKSAFTKSRYRHILSHPQFIN